MRDAIRACTQSIITVRRSSDEGCNQSVHSKHDHSDERAATHGASGGQDAEDVRVLIVPNEARNSYAISGHRRQSDAIRCNRMQADAIGCNQMQSGSSENQRCSDAIRGPQRGLELGNVREATPTKWPEVVVGVESEAEVGDPRGERLPRRREAMHLVLVTKPAAITAATIAAAAAAAAAARAAVPVAAAAAASCAIDRLELDTYLMKGAIRAQSEPNQSPIRAQSEPNQFGVGHVRAGRRNGNVGPRRHRRR